MRQFIPKKMLVIGIFLMAIAMNNPVWAVGADDILGDWLTQDGDSKVTVYKCGDKYCGKVSWLKEPVYPATDAEAGKAKHDRENPDASLKARGIMGLNLLTGFKFDDDEWVDGKIYSPKEGKTYSCYMNLENPKKLKVKGYIGMKALGKTVYWSR